MATETVDRRSGHHKSMVVTTLAALTGIAAGLVSELVVAADPTGNAGIAVLAGSIFAQFPILYAVGIDIKDFSAKDYLYVAFMTFSLWFVTWTLLLTSGA